MKWTKNKQILFRCSCWFCLYFTMFCRKFELDVIYAFLVLPLWGQICICTFQIAFCISAIIIFTIIIFTITTIVATNSTKN